MPQYFCFVPGCKSGHGRKKCGEKRPSLFKALNTTMFEEWKKVVPKGSREMKIEDRICELHFIDKYIIRCYEQRMDDGSLFTLERVVPRLAKDAVPSIFSVMSNDLSSKRKCEESNMSAEDSKKLNLSFSLEESLDLGPLPSEIVITCMEEPKEINLSFHENSAVLFSSPRRENVSSEISYSVTEEENAESFTFSFMTENLHLIKMPSSSWGISFIVESDTKYVICTKWKAYQPERRLAIDDKLNIKFFGKTVAAAPMVYQNGHPA